MPENPSNLLLTVTKSGKVKGAVKARKSKRVPAAEREVIRLVSNGATLNEACAKVGKFSSASFRDWVVDDTQLSLSYARARKLQLEHWADEILRDAKSFDDPNRARLVVDSKKWLLSKLWPQQYGDKVSLDGGDGKPITVSWLSQPPLR